MSVLFVLLHEDVNGRSHHLVVLGHKVIYFQSVSYCYYTTIRCTHMIYFANKTITPFDTFDLHNPWFWLVFMLTSINRDLKGIDSNFG
jgi:hypothetical protein